MSASKETNKRESVHQEICGIYALKVNTNNLYKGQKYLLGYMN